MSIFKSWNSGTNENPEALVLAIGLLGILNVLVFFLSIFIVSYFVRYFFCTKKKKAEKII